MGKHFDFSTSFNKTKILFSLGLSQGYQGCMVLRQTCFARWYLRAVESLNPEVQCVQTKGRSAE